MQFDSLDYVLFLGLAAAVFWQLRQSVKPRLLFVFLASCVFYMAWHPAYLVLILGSTVLDFVAGQKMADSEESSTRKRWLLASLVGNLGLLATFKYFNFLCRAACDIWVALGQEAFDPPVLGGIFANVLRALGFEVEDEVIRVLLPVGISFYTFQTLSYTIDIYRRKLEPTRNFFHFASFVTFFPQLVAGPIVRATELLPQLTEEPRLRRAQVSEGLFLFATGLVKKVVVADYLSVNLVDRVFDNPEAYTATETVIGLYAFTMQIYCDFSGYTDMARGSAKLLGLELPENFDRPYNQTNPADFWRTWHMTLSRWLRDYLYFPLGGSRVGPVRAYWNLWLTMFLIGIWHGASWNFVVYGSLQSTAMVVHRFFRRRARAKYESALIDRREDEREVFPKDSTPMRVFKIFACMQFVVFSRILFRATDWDNAGAVTERLFCGLTSTAQVSWTLWALLISTFVAHYLPRSWWKTFEARFLELPHWLQGTLFVGVAALVSLAASADVVPYIYFQF